MNNEGHAPERVTRHPTSLWLSPEDVVALDAVVGRTGYSRTEVMRILLRIGLRLHADELTPKDRRAPLGVRPPVESLSPAAA